jgi:hypothetical protein
MWEPEPEPEPEPEVGLGAMLEYTVSVTVMAGGQVPPTETTGVYVVSGVGVTGLTGLLGVGTPVIVSISVVV